MEFPTMRGSVATLHSQAYLRVREELVVMRTRAGLTQRALADRLGCPHTWVGKSELGERRIDILELIAWCRACNEDVTALVARLLVGIDPDKLP